MGGDAQRKVDVGFGIAATLFGAASLWYPLGRDQGLFYYAAREWLLRGQVLYRDVWDHKPPVIYFIHMATLALFGQHPWGIRAVELLIAVPLIAWLTARLATPRVMAPPAGTFGAAWVGVSVYYYGFSGFWDTAQCEIWIAVLGAGALVAAIHARDPILGAIGSGALSALAVFTKPTAVFFVAMAFCVVVAREWGGERPFRTAAVRALAWLGGAAAVSFVVIGYFAARHALSPMIDILVGANSAYLDQERAIRSFSDLRVYTTYYVSLLSPFPTVFIVGVAGVLFVAFARRNGRLARRYLLPVALLASSYAGVVMQLKFYHYHWQTAAAAAGVLGAALYGDMDALARVRGRWVAPFAFAALVAGLYLSSGNASSNWLSTTKATASYLSGELSRERFSSQFDIPNFYAAHDSELTGNWLRAHADAGDTVVVRGFEPQIYASSGLHYTGRFFWTAFLTMPTRIYKRSAWLAEDRKALDAASPRWAVTLSGATRGIDSAAWFERRGYVPRAVLGSFTVLELPRPEIARP